MPDLLRSLVRVAVAGVLLAAGLAASSATARADCGDHVLVLGKGGEPPASLPLMPCHGPNCSNAPKPLPPMTAAPTVTAPPQEWGVSALVPALDSDPDSSAVVPDAAGRPVRRSTSLFHPPRPV